MADTPTEDSFQFHEIGSAVPGTASDIDTSKLKEASDSSATKDSAHYYGFGTEGTMEEVLMPQERIRQTFIAFEPAPDGGDDLSYTYPSCGGAVSYCNDDFRYWPAFRKDALLPEFLHLFTINTNSEVGCKRWASNAHVEGSDNARYSSDEGSWPSEQHNMSSDYLNMNIANPGFHIRRDNTSANGIDKSAFGTVGNYLNAFLYTYAPGWSSSCEKKAAVSFYGPMGSRYEMDAWGKFENVTNKSERANIQYGGHYGEDICGGIFGFAPVNNEYYMGGLNDDDWNQNNDYAGYRWRNPNSTSNWREPDMCSGEFNPVYVAVTGGMELIEDKMNRTEHCFKCKDGRYLKDGIITKDLGDKCHGICEEDGLTDPSNYSQGFFINEGLFYESAAVNDEEL